jgi:hypothetical protein
MLSAKRALGFDRLMSAVVIGAPNVLAQGRHAGWRPNCTVISGLLFRSILTSLRVGV